MIKTEINNVAYIDGANLYNGIKQLNWKFDYGRFRIWLREKYGIEQAYLFLGLMLKNKDLYSYLQGIGYTLVFKEAIFDGEGKAKGNCDADIVVQAMQDAYENKFDSSILVSSDGDFAPLVKFLISKNKIETVLSPYETNKCSVLLKRTGVKIAYITDQQAILEIQKEKAPDGDKTS
ncbi:MAG: NYN domain-containing protein [Candidatus Vogelbacteria bacterium]|nr:NYN domain-containing protein [Candidatus Vogelbacteria bacterium]